MTQLEFSFILAGLYQVKHFIGDFPLQTRYMLRKGSSGWTFVLPLTAHCLVHGGMTLLVVLAVNPQLWWLSLVDFIVHFIMDRVKASPSMLGRLKRDSWGFWAAFGFDQMVHHLTHLYLIWVIVTQTPLS